MRISDSRPKLNFLHFFRLSFLPPMFQCFSSPPFQIPYGLFHFLFPYQINDAAMTLVRWREREIPSRKHQSTHNLNVNFFMTMTTNPFIESICRWQKSNCCEQRLCHIGMKNSPSLMLTVELIESRFVLVVLNVQCTFYAAANKVCPYAIICSSATFHCCPDKITLYEMAK